MWTVAGPVRVSHPLREGDSPLYLGVHLFGKGVARINEAERKAAQRALAFSWWRPVGAASRWYCVAMCHIGTASAPHRGNIGTTSMCTSRRWGVVGYPLVTAMMAPVSTVNWGGQRLCVSYTYSIHTFFWHVHIDSSTLTVCRGNVDSFWT